MSSRTFNRCVDLWFDDGNIVLLAGPTAFKVHSGFLERHSEIFAGILLLPMPVEDPEKELIDGCMCVELRDDPSDCVHFLTALYDGLCFGHVGSDDFHVLAAVLRLSTRYFVEPLRNQALQCLERYFPPTLEGWNKLEDGVSQLPATMHPLLVIELAMELDAPSLLPAAFYDYSRYAPSYIVFGESAHSPTTGPSAEGDASSASNPYPQHYPLARDMTIRILRGREHAQRFLAHFMIMQLTNRPPSNMCRYRHLVGYGMPCTQAFFNLSYDVYRSVGGVSEYGRDADPLYTLNCMKKKLLDYCGMCRACKQELEGEIEQARERVWRLLPRWFVLDGGYSSSIREGAIDTGGLLRY